MPELRLFERISSWKTDPQRRVGVKPARIIDSVLKHLQMILNTRQGSVQIADDYGIPDFIEFMGGYPDSLKALTQSIGKIISKYEPRLTDVVVTFLQQEEVSLTLRFQISARLVTFDENIPVLFKSVMESDGKVTIQA